MAANSAVGIPQGYSKACGSTPQAVAGQYEAKGAFLTVAGLNTYVTGSSSATKALLVVYDIFAFAPQTLQGADILASKGDRIVVVPDIFSGHPSASGSWFSPGNTEGPSERAKFFATIANAEHVIPKINPIIDGIGSMNETIASWSGLGYCWGGKIMAALCGQGTRFKCAVQTSPAFLDMRDAEEVKIPMAVLASGDEDAVAVEEYGEKLPSGSQIQVYPGMVHGWMSARGNLEDPRVKEQYEKGYEVAMNFLEKEA